MILPPCPFYFIRHGETDWNRHHLYMGTTNVPLNAAGRDQAQRAAQMLVRESISHIVTSPLLRAAETADIIAETLQKPISVIDRLQELNYGVIEGRPIDDSLQERWLQGQTPERAESAQEFEVRVLEAVKEALLFPGPVLIVSHGDIYYAVRRILQGPLPGNVKNCAAFYHTPPECPTHSWGMREVKEEG